MKARSHVCVGPGAGSHRLGIALVLLTLCLPQAAGRAAVVSEGTVTLSTSASTGEYVGDRGFARVGEKVRFVADYKDNGRHIAGATCKIVFVFQKKPFDGSNWVAEPPAVMTEEGGRYVYTRTFDKAEAVYYWITASKDGSPTLTTKPNPKTQVGDYVVVFEPVTYYRRLSNQDKARLVLPEELVYEGAIRFPGASGASRWGYGPQALTYYPEGDPAGEDDGYPGSLFGAGHPWHNCVSEISIPRPVKSPSKDYSKLNTAKTLQPFADITGGRKDKRTGHWKHLDHFGGLAYLPAIGGSGPGRLHWCFFYYYNVSNKNPAGHGWSELDLSDPKAQGTWHVGPFKDPRFSSKRTNAYLFEIPEEWAKKYVGGKRLACGKGDGCGSAGVSHGPALYAFAPWQDGNPPPDNAELSATILLMYPPSGNYMRPAWTNGDAHSGGAWLTAGKKSAVVFALRKALGRHFYGKPREGDHGGGKGYHFTPYEARLYFYDPADLAEVAQGKRKYYDVVPYAVLRPGEWLWPRPGGSSPGPLAYDRKRGLLYLAQTGLGEKPLVHVFRVVPQPQRAAR